METKKREAVVVSSHKYDHPFTDMNCAWSTIMTLFFLDGEIKTVSVGTGWGEDLEDKEPDVVIVPLTDEIKKMYWEYKDKKDAERAKAQYEKFKIELDEYNAMCKPQNVGQIVVINEGKHKGKKGKISWFGKNKYNRRSYWKTQAHWLVQAATYVSEMKPYVIPNAECDLILVRPIDGDTFEDGTSKVYVDPQKCTVIEGFEPLTMTEDDVRRMLKTKDDLCSNMHVGTAYDYREHIGERENKEQ